jgi:hypothetical protein
VELVRVDISLEDACDRLAAVKPLRQIPRIGPIRAARLIALMQTPLRFCSKGQLWTYSGLGIETRASSEASHGYEGMPQDVLSESLEQRDGLCSETNAPMSCSN